MRGIIDSYDGECGLLRTPSGTTLRFSRTALVRRSRTPVAGARIVFRLRRGAVYKAAAGPSPSDKHWLWEVAFWPLELLLYIP